MKIVILNSLLFFSIICFAQTKNPDYFLENAKNNSPLIYKNKNANTIIRLDLKKVKALLTKPQVNFETNVLFAPIISHDNGNQLQFISQGATAYTGYDFSYADGGQYQSVISLEQPLFKKSVFDAYTQKANISEQLNNNSIVLTEHELEQLVNRQYLLCLKSKKQSQISNSLINELKDELKLMQELVRNAVYKQSDLMLLQIEIKNFELEHQNYINDYQTNLSDLNLLCGISDTSTVSLENATFNLKPDTSTNSHFIEKYTLDSTNIQVGQILFEQKYKPQLSVFADAGMFALYLPSFNRFGFAAGLNLRWNIYDGNQKKIEKEKSMIKLQTLEFEKQNFITRREINKQNYVNQIQSVNNKLKIVRNQLSDYKKLMKYYKAELAQAQVSITDLKNLIRDISTKKQEEVFLQMHEQLLINSYNYWNF